VPHLVQNSLNKISGLSAPEPKGRWYPATFSRQLQRLLEEGGSLLRPLPELRGQSVPSI
jgi:hypothetical protein